jgi:hypothetical protein
LRRHCISLYASITHIRWDMEPQGGKVSGCIVPPEGGVMKSFEFVPTESSAFEIANSLWEKIGEATSATA